MSRSLLNIVNPAAHVVFSQKEQKDLSEFVFIEQKNNMTDEEFMKYITHEVDNKKSADGRINMNVGGKTLAISVSPYSKTFENNIEEKIKPLIMALKKKRYLTYSSCEGHGIHFRRYVGLAFSDLESREYFFNYITSLKLPGVVMNLRDSVANIVLDVESSKRSKLAKIENKKEVLTQTEEEKIKEINTFNIQFHRNYDFYCFLELEISEKVPLGKEFFKSFFKSLYTIYLKKFKMEKITRIITDEINSENFKKYKY